MNLFYNEVPFQHIFIFWAGSAEARFFKCSEELTPRRGRVHSKELTPLDSTCVFYTVLWIRNDLFWIQIQL